MNEEESYRIAERRWQNEVGWKLLDKPFDAPGSAAVFVKQWDRIAGALGSIEGGVVVEVGCGNGRLLARLRESAGLRGGVFVGVDISRAVFSLPAHNLAGVLADGEFLPFRSESVAVLIYDGALHHLIHYVGGLHEAMRALAPGGVLVLFEPVSSRFSRIVHRILDPLVFRKTVYESPIDRRYKGAFDEEVIAGVLSDNGMQLSRSRMDFLAYPFTGCYAGSVFSRSERFMGWLMALEDLVGKAPVLGRVARLLAWRFMIVARKPGALERSGRPERG